MVQLYKREKYLGRIRPFYHDEDIIKAITGVHRCGKSCIMQSIADELREEGVPEDNLVYVDLDARKNRKVTTPDQLEELIDAEAKNATGMKYLFVDEIQNVRGFEPLINGYRTDGGWSIFITGSNSYLLSGELVTKLTGRYLEFDVFTLDFAEYLGMKELLGKPVSPSCDEEFARYLREGGFPRVVAYDGDEEKRAYVRGIVEEIFEKDIRGRAKVRHVTVFNAVRDYLINNFGSTTSIKNLLDHFNRVEGIPIKRETLNRYIQILVDAKILYRCRRFDMKSRRSLQREEKYYLADLGFYFATNTDNRINYGPALENVVYHYACAGGYDVSVGRIGKLECDFVLRKYADAYSYVQVAMTIMNDRVTEDREYRPLEQIRDNYPKYVVTMDRLLQRRGGIRHVNIVDFLAEEREF
ncbi:MAG: ATP-binding protein [Atopobiaceae bacterium]|jgi:predicted AAA+ superfamily ATPase|nr:ATP-binding protein [Atopobiaceae bacterium]